MKRQVYFKNPIYEHGHVEPWWNNEHTVLDYSRLIKFNNAEMVEGWKSIGYACIDSTFGSIYSMPQPMPAVLNNFFYMFKWNDIAISVFKMQQGDILPTHADHYTFYKNMYKIKKIEDIHRCIVFLEDWDIGHYFDINGTGIVNWKKGDYVAWSGNTLHMAANIGTTNRYTLQITGNSQ
jgi:hypothetical protein